ncbi:MAG: aldo/keto reductase [Thermoclostridium sp.]|nr:aldo/keto reductase [Thermoclostridium sp.]
MKNVLLKDTSLTVSHISLGTVHYGTVIDEKTAESQMSFFTDNGGNFIDTAHIYGDWVPGPKGISERIIGAWLKKSGLRHKTVISTKGGHPDLAKFHVSRATPKDILKDLDESLQFLNTDYIDLYFYHRDNPDIPAEELLGVLEQARANGKIRYYGCSNWPLSRIQQVRRQDFPGFVCNQIMYSLADINEYNISDKTLVLMDQELYRHHCETGLNVMAYTSLAKGYFTKTATGQSIPAQTARWYSNASNERIFAELTRKAHSLNCSLSELELAFLMHQGFVTVPIVSFSSQQQLEQGLKSCDLTLDSETVEKLNNLKKYVYLGAGSESPLNL